VQSFTTTLKTKLRNSWSLIKSLQTFLLLFTGLAGYMSARCPVLTLPTLIGLTGSLFLTISGSTVLNMVYDRDIDSCMQRTAWRPLPAGTISRREATILGFSMSALGLLWAVTLSTLFAVIVFAGLFLDMVVYTIWLKRRTPWAILWGGLAGGMPVLAGRALGLGSIDWVGLTLAATVLLWIPIHIMTFHMRHRDDYRLADIPTFPAVYGEKATRIVIAAASIAAALAAGAAAYGVGMSWGYMRLLILLGVGMFALAISSVLRPSSRVNLSLFKYASAYMLSSMALLFIEGL
jgi:protoheme IX farnesyltransferase